MVISTNQIPVNFPLVGKIAQVQNAHKGEMKDKLKPLFCDLCKSDKHGTKGHENHQKFVHNYGPNACNLPRA